MATAGGCFATAGFEYVDGPMPAQLEILDGTNVFYANETDHLVDAERVQPHGVAHRPPIRLEIPYIEEIPCSDGPLRIGQEQSGL